MPTRIFQSRPNVNNVANYDILLNKIMDASRNNFKQKFKVKSISHEVHNNLNCNRVAQDGPVGELM
jgi:hypothetical protein